MHTAFQQHKNKQLLLSPEQNIPEICRQWLNNDPLFLDTETTGLDEKAEIVELAVVNGKCEVLINTLIKPASPIPAVVTELHGISNETVADAPDWHDIYPEVRSLLTGRRIISYNARFDARMLIQTCGFYRLPGLPADWLCAMRLYQKYAGNRRRVKLTKAAATCGVTVPDQIHRALADTLLCLGVVRSMAKDNGHAYELIHINTQTYKHKYSC